MNIMFFLSKNKWWVVISLCQFNSAKLEGLVLTM